MKTLDVLRIIRLHIVVGGVLAFFLGVFLAVAEGGVFEPIHVIISYVVVLLGDLSTHFSNDYFDIEIDKQTQTKKFFSGKKLLVKFPELHSVALTVSLILFFLSIVVSAVLVVFFGLPLEFFIITVVANIFGLIYSAPPFRLCSRSLGALIIAFVTGFVIPGVGYLTVMGHFDSFFVGLSVPFVLYGFLLSLNLQAPDIDCDKKGKKRTFAVLIGARHVFFVVLAVTFFVPLTFFVLSGQLAFSVVDLDLIFLFSFVPLVTAFFGFVGFFKKRDLNKFSALNILSLFLFISLLNIYCLLLFV